MIARTPGIVSISLWIVFSLTIYFLSTGVSFGEIIICEVLERITDSSTPSENPDRKPFIKSRLRKASDKIQTSSKEVDLLPFVIIFFATKYESFKSVRNGSILYDSSNTTSPSFTPESISKKPFLSSLPT